MKVGLRAGIVKITPAPEAYAIESFNPTQYESELTTSPNERVASFW